MANRNNRLGFYWVYDKTGTPGTGYQIFQAFRFLGLLAAALSVPILSNSDADPSEYESLTLAGTAVSFFWVTGLFDSLVVRFHAAQPSEQASVLNAGFWLANACALASILAMMPILAFSSGFPYAVFLFFELAGFFLPIYLLVKGKGHALSILGLVAYGGYALWVAIGMHQGWGLVEIFWVCAAWGSLRWLGSLILAKPWERPEFEQMKRLASLALPVSGVALLGQGALVIDGYLAKYFHPGEFTAFRYGSKEFPLTLLMANAFSTTYSGMVASAVKQDKIEQTLELVKRNSINIIYLSFSFTFILLCISHPAFEWVLDGRYPAAAPVFDLCLLMVLPRMLFPQTVVRGHEKGWILTAAATMELILKLGLSFLLLPLMGLAGLVLATVLALLFEKAILMWYCDRKLGLPVESYTPVKPLIVLSLLLLGMYGIKYSMFGLAFP
jgi:O-antigen/teichoic acid export membrane protein